MEIIKEDDTHFSIGEPIKCNLSVWESPLFQTTREEDIYVASVVDQLFPDLGKERTRAMYLLDRLYYEAKLKCQQQLLAIFLERKK